MNETSALSVFLRGMRLILSGKCTSPKNRIGESIILNRNGNSYIVFKQTALKKFSDNNDNGAYFFVEFKFKRWVLDFFSPTIPFFLGMPGFKSKLWLVDKNRNVFAGRYVFSSSGNANAYGNSSAQKFVKKLCIPGQHHWWVQPIQ
jgi:hypothetical protein